MFWVRFRIMMACDVLLVCVECRRNSDQEVEEKKILSVGEKSTLQFEVAVRVMLNVENLTLILKPQSAVF